MTRNQAKIPPEGSGLYRTPVDLEASLLRSGAAPAQWIDADLSGVRTKHALLEALARAASLPAHFGMNWDALADSLQDLPLTGSTCFLRLSGAKEARKALQAEWSTLLEILEDAAIYWKEHDEAFVVFIDDAAELPEWR